MAARLYTFGLRYSWGVEEIDVEANSAAEAERLARSLAASDYEPGWTLVSLPPGGSGGMVQVFG